MWPGWERAGWWAQVVRADFGLHVESFAVYGEGASQFCRAQDWVDRDHFLNELSLLSAWEGQRERAARRRRTRWVSWAKRMRDGLVWLLTLCARLTDHPFATWLWSDLVERDASRAMAGQA